MKIDEPRTTSGQMLAGTCVGAALFALTLMYNQDRPIAALLDPLRAAVAWLL